MAFLSFIITFKKGDFCASCRVCCTKFAIRSGGRDDCGHHVEAKNPAFSLEQCEMITSNCVIHVDKLTGVFLKIMLLLILVTLVPECIILG